MENTTPIAIEAVDAPVRSKSFYPQPFAERMTGREKRPLGNIFGIKNFGVNLTRLAPGACSALLHRHSLQEEFIYILEGQPTLITDTQELQLKPGMCAGFTPQHGSHQLINRTASEVVYLEIGDRTQGDKVSYPKDDLVAGTHPDGQRYFTHKDGTPY